MRTALNHLGGALDPHACFLLARGLKTLALRVRAQNANAAALARFLDEHPRVARSTTRRCLRIPTTPTPPSCCRASAAC